MPIYPADMAKARAEAQQRIKERQARRDELARRHAETMAEAERLRREFAEAFDVHPGEVSAFICTRGVR